MSKDEKRTARRTQLWALSLLLLVATSLSAQTTAQPQVSPGVSIDSARKTAELATSATTENNHGSSAWGYEVKQSFEFGGRVIQHDGSEGIWDTFVNLGSGPRLLEYTLDMHATQHNGLFFDDLSFTNFGYGGDPNNLSRVRAQKGRLYNFNASFRRDLNVFDYDLLANPLNPSNSSPNVPILQSLHRMGLTRRMSDVNLTLLPTSRVRFRLGWNRVVNEGRSFTSDHQGTEALMYQPTRNSTDNYQGGITIRLFPRTSINYDQFYTYFKGDTTAGLFGLPYALAGGVPVDLGVSFNTAAGQPCATPLLAGGPPPVNPACNGYFGYGRAGNTRNSFPTEQFSLQSNYFRRLDISARVSYSDAEARMVQVPLGTLDADGNLQGNEVFAGLITRSRQRRSEVSGPASSHRVSATADLAATVRVTDQFRIVDTFRWDNFRIPGAWNLTTMSAFGATLLSTPNLFDLATCPPPFTAATCPQHSASSGADVVSDQLNQFLRQEQKLNLFELEYDLSRRFAFHLGYRFRRRHITDNFLDVQNLTFYPTLPNRGACAGLPVVNGVCTTSTSVQASTLLEINEHALLAGISARPTHNLRLGFDSEIFYADKAFTRISPRQLQRYRLRATYHPKEWVSLGTTFNILENRNRASDIGNLQHNRSYGLTAAIEPPGGRWGLDLSYDYNDIFSQTDICFVATPTPPGTLSCGTPFLLAPSVYKDRSHFGSGSLFYRPISRVTAAFGYTITSSAGDTLILNPLAPTGPLSFNYHLPGASLAVELSRHFTYKAGWNYYDYNEKSDPGPTLPRDMRGNAFTLSLRYSM